MTQHEYIFIAISVVLGLAMARTTAYRSAARSCPQSRQLSLGDRFVGRVYLYLYPAAVVGRLGAAPGHRLSILDFFSLVIGAVFVYGAAELALPTEDYDVTDHTELDFCYTAGHSAGYRQRPCSATSRSGPTSTDDVWQSCMGIFRVPCRWGHPGWIDLAETTVVSIAVRHIHGLHGDNPLPDGLTGFVVHARPASCLTTSATVD